MVLISIRYEGQLHCQAQHGPSKTLLDTDAPVDNCGRGESFSPTDLVATALGSCIATTMAIYAERHQIDLKGMTVEVEKHMSTDGPRRIAKLVTRLRLPAGIPVEQRLPLERAAEGCPVHRSLAPEMEKPIQFEWT
jgi:putative redox protein